MGASVVLMSFIELDACHNNGMINFFTCCDLFEIKYLLVILLLNIFMHSSKTLAALSSHDAVVNMRCVASKWTSVFVQIKDVDPDIVLLLQYMIDCRLPVSSKPLSAVPWCVPPYHSNSGIVKHAIVTDTDTVCWRLIHQLNK
jgi:hypothetical protein